MESSCDNVEAALGYLAAIGVVRRDEVESLPEGFKGLWITSPDSIIHFVADEEDA